jgi:hypothetical protein
MREKLQVYSNILQLDTETLLDFKYAPDGLVRALQMFFIVTLIAGIGLWLGIPVQIDRPVFYEVFDNTQELVTDFTVSIEPYLEQNIPFLRSPEKLAEPIGDLSTAVGESVNNVLLMAETGSEAVSPPLGPRLSRIIRLFGQWLSVPFMVMSNWFFLALVAMLVAKVLGGRATLGQHLTAVLLASAPLILLLPTFIPDLSRVMPITFAFGISLFARIISLVGYGWALLILIKGLELAHEVSWWRATSILLISWISIYILLPLIAILIGGYIIGF